MTVADAVTVADAGQLVGRGRGAAGNFRHHADTADNQRIDRRRIMSISVRLWPRCRRV